MIRALSLCAGAGGLDLGLKLALGTKLVTVGYVEREAFAAANLVARMGGEALGRAPIWDDLETFDGEAYRGRVDLIQGGFPCQPFSDAGKQLGVFDARWLWDDFARVIRETAAPLVFLENVPGLLSTRMGDDHGQRAMGAVLGDLADLGFDAEWDVFSSAGVGAPHRRRRVYVLAWRVPKGDMGGDLADAKDSIRGIGVQGFQGFQGERGEGSRGEGTSLADPDGRGREGEREPEQEHERARWGEPDGRGDDWRQPRPPGPDGDWSRVPPEAQPAIRGVADGMAARVDRLRAVGNGVDPLVAAHAFRVLQDRMKR